MMLIGVAGTEDRIAADSVMPAIQQGISVILLVGPHVQLVLSSRAGAAVVLFRGASVFLGQQV